MNSIRRRLLIAVIGGSAALVVIVGVALLLVVRTALLSEYDAGLRAEAGALAAMTGIAGDALDVDFDPKLMPEFNPGKHAEYFEFWVSDGSVLERSPSLKDSNLTFQGGPEPHLWSMRLPDGSRARACGLEFIPHSDDDLLKKPDIDRPHAPPGPIRLVVARSISELDQMLSVLVIAALSAGALLVGGIALLAGRAVSRGLSPLDRLGRTVAAIEPEQLGARVDLDVPAELRPIAGRLNDLLDRLQHAFERERRFSAAAAHELRTPVAELRALADVALLSAADPAERTAALGEARDIAIQMERIIGALLSISRARQGAQPLDLAPLDLGALLTELWEQRILRAGRSGSLAAPPGLVVHADPYILRVILTNLLDNAAAYAPAGASIGARLESVADAAHLSISNPAPNLKPDDLARLFEPFWRKQGFNADAAHAGLGLALVRAFADLHDLGLTARLRDGALVMTLSIPTSDTGATSPRDQAARRAAASAPPITFS